jgi:hypothetical protein
VCQMINKFILSCFVSLVITTSGWAAASPGSVVRGNTRLNIHTQDVTTIATGGAVARTSIGHVRSSRGNTNITVNVPNVSNIASGNRKSCINIGTKGLDPDCN